MTDLPRQRRRNFYFDRSICLGDIIGVLTIVGALLSAVWWTARQSQRLDYVAGVTTELQSTMGTFQTDLAVVKQQVQDIHEAVKK